MPHRLRIAGPVSNLARAQAMYCAGLGWQVLGNFQDHAGFDGVILGPGSGDHHFEFTCCRTRSVAPAPTPEDLVVFYVPEVEAWEAACARIFGAGFRQVSSFNPYWDARGRTFEDPDGYRVVVQNAAWDSRKEP